MSTGREEGHQWHRLACFQLKGSSSSGVGIGVRGRRVLRAWGTGGGGAESVGGGLSQAERGLAALLGWSCWVRLMSTSCSWLLDWLGRCRSRAVGAVSMFARSLSGEVGAGVGVPMWK